MDNSTSIYSLDASRRCIEFPHSLYAGASPLGSSLPLILSLRGHHLGLASGMEGHPFPRFSVLRGGLKALVARIPVRRNLPGQSRAGVAGPCPS